MGESGESAESISAVVQRMKAEDFVMDLNREGMCYSIMVKGIDDFRHKMKQESRQTLSSHFPNWDIIEAQKTVVIDRILKMIPLSELVAPAFHPHERIYVNALICEARSNRSDFQNLDGLRKIVKEVYGKTLLNNFPNWRFTEMQKAVVISRILQTLPKSAFTSEIPQPQVALYQNAFESVLKSDESSNFPNVDAALQQVLAGHWEILMENFGLATAHVSRLQKKAVVAR